MDCDLTIVGGNVHMCKAQCICQCWESGKDQLAPRK